MASCSNDALDTGSAIAGGSTMRISARSDVLTLKVGRETFSLYSSVDWRRLPEFAKRDAAMLLNAKSAVLFRNFLSPDERNKSRQGEFSMAQQIRARETNHEQIEQGRAGRRCCAGSE